MREKLAEIKLNLPWIERLDLVNAPAPLAPELALQMQEQEVRRAKQLKGNKKLPQYDPSEDPILGLQITLPKWLRQMSTCKK